MTEFAFETKLETRGIQNYQASFKAKNAVKSMFKAVLEGLEKQDEFKFFRVYLENLQKNFSEFSGKDCTLLNPCKPERLIAGVIADFPDVIFYTPFIRPIDHLYNLNRIQTPPFRTVNPEAKSDVRLANQFINIFNAGNYNTTQKSDATVFIQNPQLGINQILPIYAAIFDWLDKNNEIYDSDVYGTIGAEREYYAGTKPAVSIKNGYLDILSEVQLIPLISQEQIPLAFWEIKFTTYPVGRKYNRSSNFSLINPRININLATSAEIIEFLEQFDQNTVYFASYSSKDYENIYEQDLFQKRNEIAEELTKLPRSKLNNKDIKNKLKNITQYYSKTNDFFTANSFWYKIHLKTEIDNVIAEVKAVVSVERKEETGKVTKLSIHSFWLR